MVTDSEYEELMSRNVIYGDDMSYDEICDRYIDEGNASFALCQGVKDSEYDQLNNMPAFQTLENRLFRNHLSPESTDGKELLSMASIVGKFVIIEPEKMWWSSNIGGQKAQYTKPISSGGIDLPDHSFDLAASFWMLHHISNVSYVVSEFARTLRPGGVSVMRERALSCMLDEFRRAIEE